MKRALLIVWMVGLALLVIGAGWKVLAPRTLPAASLAVLLAGLLCAGVGLWAQRDVFFAAGGVRRARFGAGALATSALGLALLLLVNFAAARYQERWDLTRNREFSLHPVTLRVLQTLERDVDVYAFVPESDIQQVRAARALYGLFALHQPKLRVTVADPALRPDLLEKLQLRGTRMTVVTAGDRKTFFSGFEEADLASALLEVGRATPRVAYWVQGHGERAIDTPGGSGFVQLEKELRASYLQVRLLTLGRGERVPEDASLLIFNDPRRPIPDAEARRYDEWLRRGNRALVLQDVQTGAGVGVSSPAAPLLERWGLRASDAVVVDPRARTGDPEPRTVVADGFGRHPAVQALIGSLAIFPLARPLEFFQVAEDQQIFHHALVWVGPDAQGTGNDPYGTSAAIAADGAVTVTPAARAAWGGRPLNVALAAFRRFEPRPGELYAGREARVVLVGDADFANDANIVRESNRELALNVIRWLTGEELLIRRAGEIRTAKTAMALEPYQHKVVRLLVIIIPVVTFLSGWIVWALRRVK